MHFKILISIASTIIILTASIMVSAEQQHKQPIPPIAPAQPGTENVSVPNTDLDFFETGIFDVNGVGPILGAAAYGDMTKGEHSTFIRMPSGFKGAVHTHTHDFWVTVISGVAVNTAVNGKDIVLPSGSYWFQPGGKPHYTNCISSIECVYFVSQNGAFDYNVLTK